MSFLAWDGQVPVAVALLIAAAAGLFLATVAGALRILQLRRRVRRDRPRQAIATGLTGEPDAPVIDKGAQTSRNSCTPSWARCSRTRCSSR